MARSDQAAGAVAVTPNDGTDLPFISFGLYVGGAGNINAVLADGSAVLISGVAAGTILPFQFKRILATSTTATLMLALKQ